MLINNSKIMQGMFFLLLAQVTVGINIVASKYLISSIPTGYLLLIRFALASLILFVIHLASPSNKETLNHHFCQLNRKDWLFILGQALSAGVLFNFLMLMGLEYTDANVAGIITSALPAIIAVFSWRFLGETFSKKTKLSVLLATLGLIVIGSDKLKGIGTSHSFLGDVIVFASLLPEAMYYILCKMHPNKLPLFLTSSLLNGINALILLCFLPFMNVTGITLHAIDWGILLILGLSSGLFYVLWFVGCQRVDGMITSLSTAMMPVATVLLALIFLDEKMTLALALGMGLVMFSILIHAKR